MTPGTLTRQDLTIGTAIALAMAGGFVWAGGQALLSTFVPGLLVTWAIFLWMDLSRNRAAPSARLSHLPFKSDRAFPA
jgi:hypothetical protein